MHDADPIVNDLRLRNPYDNEGKQEINTYCQKIDPTTPSTPIFKPKNVETWKQLTTRKCLGCVSYMIPGAAATVTALWVYFTCYFSDQCPI